ncbi:MAG: four helix bundle protein [Bacteroidota bacterium]
MNVQQVTDLHVYTEAFSGAMELFECSKAWPRDERYALTDQVRRSSRAVCANVSEAWAKRRYPIHFASKLSDAHAESEETLTWLRFAERCGYLDTEAASELAIRYRKINAGLLRMISTRDRLRTGTG